MSLEIDGRELTLHCPSSLNSSVSSLAGRLIPLSPTLDASAGGTFSVIRLFLRIETDHMATTWQEHSEEISLDCIQLESWNPHSESCSG